MFFNDTPQPGRVESGTQGRAVKYCLSRDTKDLHPQLDGDMVWRTVKRRLRGVAAVSKLSAQESDVDAVRLRG